MKNALGIIGGMGPLASELFYKMLTEKTAASSDQEHLNAIIFSHADMPDRTSAILSGDSEKIAHVRDLLLADALSLESLGCRARAVTCNTAHFFVDMISSAVGIPFIHMIKEAAAETARLIPGGKVAILATDGTISTGLYQKALAEAGVVPFVPQPDVQALVMHEIYDCIKAGRPADRESWAAIDRHLRELGCQKALLACTELSVIRSAEGLPDFYLDPMEIMAVRALEFMGVAQAPLSAPAPSCP